MENMYGIDKSAHYFILMHPLESILGLITFTSSNTREKWVECEVVEEQYKVDEEYKVELRSIEPGYGKETYYQCDFKNHLERGFIIKKSSESQHVEEVTWKEPFLNNTFLVHSAYVVMN